MNRGHGMNQGHALRQKRIDMSLPGCPNELLPKRSCSRRHPALAASETLPRSLPTRGQRRYIPEWPNWRFDRSCFPLPLLNAVNCFAFHRTDVLSELKTHYYSLVAGDSLDEALCYLVLQ